MTRPEQYAVSVGGTEYKVVVGEAGLFVDDQPVAFELASLNGNGLHLFRQGQRSTEMYFKTTDHADYEVLVNGHRLVARVDPAHRRSRLPRDAGRDGEVRAPMPGLIVDVLVEVGQHIEAGQTLLIQESMKMQMQLRSPCAGRVAEVRVVGGEQVGKDAPLVHISSSDGSPVEPVI